MGILLLAILASGVPGRAGAQAPDSTRLALARQVLTLTHSTDQAIQSMEVMVQAQRSLNPRIPGVFWDRFLARVQSSKDEFTSMLAEIYGRRFTEGELRQLIAFHQSPIGQRLIALQPDIARESMEAGQAWGGRIGRAIGEELAAEGTPLE